jgi:hypothetical protein
MIDLLSNVIDDHGNLETMLAPKNVLKQSGFPTSLISKRDQYFSLQPRHP